ncbi:MAG TPA: tetratricopeptide repeat protein [Bryobacteraceae bacterium]|jgi:tetratricopeptide (TPR) repeat protein|nr:tetratricopeptide repeat protein [Bryobacteraceae bacterium]
MMRGISLALVLAVCASGACVVVPPEQKELYRTGNLAAAKCFFEAGEQGRAFALLSELQKKFPNNADVLYLEAKLHMKAFNDATFAMFEHAPNSYRVHELSGEIFETQNRYKDAAEEYRKAIALAPGAPDLHFRLGRALLLESHDRDALAGAEEAFREELKLSPGDGACEFQLGQIAQVRAEPAEAKKHFEEALEMSPDFVQAMIALAKIDIGEKNYSRAIELLSRATVLQPANETAHYALMQAYRDSGDLEKAKAEKKKLDQLQKPPEGEFSDFLKKLGEKAPQ